jgi:hypothetical protein
MLRGDKKGEEREALVFSDLPARIAEGQRQLERAGAGCALSFRPGSLICRAFLRAVVLGVWALACIPDRSSPGRQGLLLNDERVLEVTNQAFLCPPPPLPLPLCHAWLRRLLPTSAAARPVLSLLWLPPSSLLLLLLLLLLPQWTSHSLSGSISPA